MIGTISRFGAVLVTWFGLTQIVLAGAILDTGTLQTADQNMWSDGTAAVLRAESFLGVKWGTYAGDPAESVSPGIIVGSEFTAVPGTGGTIPNPGWVAWQAAMAVCPFARSTCINGSSAVRACAFGACVTIVPAIPGLGNEPAETINNPIGAQYVDTRTGLKATLETSGEVGIVPWVDATGGSIDVDVPFSAVISMPDNIQQGVNFLLQTSAQINSGALITATAPSFKAGVDGVLNMDNTLTGEACVIFAGCDVGTKSLDIDAGRFGIVSIDTTQDNFLRVLGDAYGADSFGVPGIAFNTQYNIYAPTPENPDGVDDETTPAGVLSGPKLGDVTVSNPQNFSGGTFADGQLTLEHYQELLALNYSVTGIAELALGSPGILAKKITLIPNPVPGLPALLAINYTLLDVGVGPRYGVDQKLDLVPNLSVRLEFDRPVTRVDQFGSTAFADGIIEVALGSTLALRFDGEVGQLIKRTYFLDDPVFSNLTQATLDPGTRLKLGCIDVSGVPEQCIFNQDYQTEGLLGIDVVKRSWVLGGFNQLSFLTPLVDGELPPIGGGGTPPTSVPEPSSLVLLGLGLLLLVGLNVRRDSRAH